MHGGGGGGGSVVSKGRALPVWEYQQHLVT